jgi:hypothetical protein
LENYLIQAFGAENVLKQKPSQGLVSLAPFELEITGVGTAKSTMPQNLSVGNNKVLVGPVV